MKQLLATIGPTTFSLLLLCSAAIAQTPGTMGVITTDSATFPLQITPWGVTGFPFEQPAVTLELNQFDPTAFPGWTLEEVCLILDGVAETTISVTAVGDVAVNGGTVGAEIIASNFSTGPSTLSLNALPGGNYPGVNLFAGNTDGPNQINGTDSDSESISGADIAAYTGSGTFAFDVSANGSSVFDTTGGNVDASQDTVASATVRVEYKGTFVPEPTGSSMVLIALLWLTGIARKRR